MKTLNKNKMHRVALFGLCALMAGINLSMNSQSFASRDLASLPEFNERDLRERGQRTNRRATLNTQIDADDIKLTGYKAGKITKVGNKYQVKATFKVTDAAGNIIKDAPRSEVITLSVETVRNEIAGGPLTNDISDVLDLATGEITTTPQAEVADSAVTEATSYVLSLKGCECEMDYETTSGKATSLDIAEQAKELILDKVAAKIEATRKHKAYIAESEKQKDNCNVWVDKADNNKGFSTTTRTPEEKVSCKSEIAEYYMNSSDPVDAGKYRAAVNSLMAQCTEIQSAQYQDSLFGLAPVGPSPSRYSNNAIVMHFDTPAARVTSDSDNAYCGPALQELATNDESGYARQTLSNYNSFLQARNSREQLAEYHFQQKQNLAIQCDAPSYSYSSSNQSLLQGQQQICQNKRAQLETKQQEENTWLNSQFQSELQRFRATWSRVSYQDPARSGMLYQANLIGNSYYEMQARLNGQNALQQPMLQQDAIFTNSGRSSYQRIGDSVRGQRGFTNNVNSVYRTNLDNRGTSARGTGVPSLRNQGRTNQI